MLFRSSERSLFSLQQATRALVLLLLFLAPAVAERALPRGVALDVSLSAAAGAAAALEGLPGGELPPSVALRVRLPWADLELAPGVFDWDDLDRCARAARESGLSLMPVLTGPSPEGLGVPVEDGAELERWLAFVQEAVERVGETASAWQVWDGANDAASWGRSPSVREYAFLLKKTAIAIKAVNPDAHVAQGALDASVSFQSDLFDEGIAPFLDAYGVAPAGSKDFERAHRLLARLVAERDPGAATWVHAAGPFSSFAAVSGEARLWSSLLEAREAGFELASLPWPVGPEVTRAFGTYARAFPLDASPAVVGSRRVVSFHEARVHWSRHVVASDLSQRIIYRSERGENAQDVLARLRDAGADAIRVFDPAGEFEGGQLEALRLKDKGYTRVRLPLARRPLVLAFSRAVDEDALAEDQQVAGARRWTVEEVLARHLEVQAAQERALENWQASLTTAMQYRLGTVNRPVSVRIEGTYYRQADGTVEIENEAFFLGGARFDPKRPPELPLLQPEKVTVVPLDVHLDRSYGYRLEGTDIIDGREAFRVSFEPLPLSGEARTGRQEGTVWIDAGTFRKLRLRAADVDLEPPVLSNEQVDHYGLVADSSGADFSLVQRSEISRSVILIGATIQVTMRLDFEDHRINEIAFEQSLTDAHASSHQMLRETHEGFRYLRADGAGGRELAEEDSRKLFVIGGARYDAAFGGVIPLAGVNWLDYDFRGQGLQLNVFAAGAINTLSLSDPSLAGTRVEGGFDVFLPVVQRRDRLLLPGEADTDDSQEARTRRPSLDLNVNVPIGQFGKLSATLGIAHENWNTTDDTAVDFRVPNDGFVLTAQLAGEVNRKGWKGRAWVERAHRTDWEAWGPADGTTPGDEFFEEDDDRYWRWGARVTKDWFISSLQRIDVQLDYFGGSGLDRFSQYEFGSIAGPQVAGFSGSGIHFDRAVIGHVAWAFDVAGFFGLRLQADYASIANNELPSAELAAFGTGAGTAGLGLSGTVPGPWGSFVTFDVGWAAWSDDYEEAEGDVVAQVIFWKFMR